MIQFYSISLYIVYINPINTQTDDKCNENILCLLCWMIIYIITNTAQEIRVEYFASCK